MIELIRVCQEIQRVCREHRLEFCFIGGIALQRWGEPRVTQDVDLSILTGFGGERAVTAVLLAAFKGRIPDAGEFALRARVLLLETDTNIGIDVALAALRKQGLKEVLLSGPDGYFIDPSVAVVWVEGSTTSS